MSILTFKEAIRQAQLQLMESDPNVFVMGLGVTDGVFGTTEGLPRCLDAPASENAITGVAIGSSLAGARPILVHQRMDFSLLSFDQLVNQAAKWHFMFGGTTTCPITIRMIVGRGWGNGPQHTQDLTKMLQLVQGLRIYVPDTPYEAKGMLIAAVETESPAIHVERRWLFDDEGDVPDETYRCTACLPSTGELPISSSVSDVEMSGPY